MSTLKNYYSKIEALKEAADFMRVVQKWDVLSKRIGSEKQIPMVLPDLLWVAKSGVGKTHLLKLLSEYLYECGNLMDFHGNVKYFEFMLDYCSPDKPFEEIQRMINEVRNAAGFRNLYKGIISVDIEEWLGHCEEKHFISFLEYLSSNSDDWLVIFNVTGENEAEVEKLESILTMYFRLEKSILSLPNTEDLLRFVSERLSLFDLSLDDSAQELIYHVIEKLRANKYFDGYKTLIILCQDIAYEVYSGMDTPTKTISAIHLKHFAPDSAYIQRATWKVEHKSRIGLIRRENE